MTRLIKPAPKLLTRRGLLRAAGVVAPALLLNRPVLAQFGACLPAFCGAAVSPPSNCDPFWNDVKLLLSFNGPDGVVVGPAQAAITDQSPANQGPAFTFAGGTSAYTAAASVLGYSTSLNFAGGGARLSFNDSPDWNLSNRLWTIETWVRPAGISGTFVVGQWSDSAGQLGWITTVSDSLGLAVSTNGSNVFGQLASGAVLSSGSWFPIAEDFDGTTYRAYVNGVVVDSSTTLRTFFDSSVFLTIGAGQLGAFSYVGEMQELRITLDRARYAGAYTPTTIPFPRVGC